MPITKIFGQPNIPPQSSTSTRKRTQSPIQQTNLIQANTKVIERNVKCNQLEFKIVAHSTQLTYQKMKLTLKSKTKETKDTHASQNKFLVQNSNKCNGLQELLDLQGIRSDRNNQIFSNANAEHYSKIMKSILQMAKQEINLGTGSKNLSLSNTLDNQLKEIFNQYQTSNNNASPSKEKFLGCIKDLKKEIIKGLDRLSPKHGKVLFKKYYPEALNQNADAWKSHNPKVTLFDKNNSDIKFTSSLKPAWEMKCFSHLKNDKNDKPPYGISSMDRTTEHAMNLWETSVKVNYSTDNSPILFQAIRHGCTRGQEEATKEILTACLVQQLGGIDNIDNINKITSNKNSKDNPYKLKLANIQLMTAGKGGDKNLPTLQMETFQNLALTSKKEPIELQIPGPDGKQRTVYIKLEQALTFNFGANLQQYSTLLTPFIKNLDKENFESLKVLMGENVLKDPEQRQGTYNNDHIAEEAKIFGTDTMVGKFLSEHTDEKDKKIVIQLAHQIADIWKSKRYKTDESDPYAIQSRLALLTYKLGLSTTFNCKSGKDRTGVASAEIQHLATEVYMNGGKVPKPYHSLEDHEKHNLSTLLTSSGADRVTKACTGLGGLKIVNSFSHFIKFTGTKNRMGDVTGASSEAKEI